MRDVPGRAGDQVKRKMKSGDEYDVFTKWRRYMAWTKKPGATARVKRGARRRERREAKTEIRREQ